MKKLLFGLAALPMMFGVAFAAEKAPSYQLISDVQMDKVTAGFDFIEREVTNTSNTIVAINRPALAACGNCFITLTSSWAPGTPQLPFQVQSKFGP